MKKTAKISKMLGFSLLELLVVVAILGTLIALVGPAIMKQADQAKVTAAKTDIATISGALDRYNLDNFQYPTTDQGLEALVNKPSIEPMPKNWIEGGYLKRFPKDPWGNDYIYLSPGSDGRDYDIISLGKDGKEGGEGFAQDITNW